ncbi:conserved hypothetical protein [Perkinsus marinus ATCC 50983]|uniref:Uncharacterized protein n=1 Tax=Perkinsus marinus (strain ATCC 50983 / TXsc) TaxID=423536 RepID=C5L213_PERM5|nr:conserved hypothetical protein [Perkinsus marinus ATCC 50983]EER09206.1 conserved hypothetical protein [Perkinsus marinus ATCC 50983]|eukprot:XP_002777390.1 conserved hypothetical protein [Perkinsus marinus ATCC 50983]
MYEGIRGELRQWAVAADKKLAEHLDKCRREVAASREECRKETHEVLEQASKGDRKALIDLKAMVEDLRSEVEEVSSEMRKDTHTLESVDSRIVQSTREVEDRMLSKMSERENEMKVTIEELEERFEGRLNGGQLEVRMDALSSELADLRATTKDSLQCLDAEVKLGIGRQPSEVQTEASEEMESTNAEMLATYKDEVYVEEHDSRISTLSATIQEIYAMLREFVESGIPVVEGSYEFGGIRGSFLKDSEKAHSNPDYDDKKHMVGNKSDLINRNALAHSGVLVAPSGLEGLFKRVEKLEGSRDASQGSYKMGDDEEVMVDEEEEEEKIGIRILLRESRSWDDNLLASTAEDIRHTLKVHEDRLTLVEGRIADAMQDLTKEQAEHFINRGTLKSSQASQVQSCPVGNMHHDGRHAHANLVDDKHEHVL